MKLLSLLKRKDLFQPLLRNEAIVLVEEKRFISTSIEEWSYCPCWRIWMWKTKNMSKTWLSLSHFSVVEKLCKKKFGLLIFYRIIIPSFNTIWFQEGGINIARIQSIGFFVKKIQDFKILTVFCLCDIFNHYQVCKNWRMLFHILSEIHVDLNFWMYGNTCITGKLLFTKSIKMHHIMHIMTIQLNIPCVQICPTCKIQFKDFAPAHRSTSYTFQHYEYELQIKKLLLTNFFCLSRAPRTWTRMWLYENNN